MKLQELSSNGNHGVYGGRYLNAIRSRTLDKKYKSAMTVRYHVIYIARTYVSTHGK
jgi:hypothetical protein